MDADENYQPKVIGVGYGRTGTASLSKALNILNIKTKHYIGYKNYIKSFDKRERTFQIESVQDELKDFQAIANGTGLPYTEIDKYYPKSKFILTIREKESWLKSKKKYSEIELKQWPWLNDQTKKAKILVREKIYGSFNFDADVWYNAYQSHVNNVQIYFKYRSSDLLIMNIPKGDGWEKLCPFLGCTIPFVAFPKANSSNEVEQWMNIVTSIRKQIDQIVGPSNQFILVDQNILNLQHQHALPFLEVQGKFWGIPGSSCQAISELDRMIKYGAKYIVFIFDTFWWLDYFSEFNAFLNSSFSKVFENETIKIYKL